MKKRCNRSHREHKQALSSFVYISSRNAKLVKDRKEARKKLTKKED